MTYFPITLKLQLPIAAVFAAIIILLAAASATAADSGAGSGARSRTMPHTPGVRCINFDGFDVAAGARAWNAKPRAGAKSRPRDPLAQQLATEPVDPRSVYRQPKTLPSGWVFVGTHFAPVNIDVKDARHLASQYFRACLSPGDSNDMIKALDLILGVADAPQQPQLQLGAGAGSGAGSGSQQQGDEMFEALRRLLTDTARVADIGPQALERATAVASILFTTAEWAQTNPELSRMKIVLRGLVANGRLMYNRATKHVAATQQPQPQTLGAPTQSFFL